jgi:hypothetical protein
MEVHSLKMKSVASQVGFTSQLCTFPCNTFGKAIFGQEKVQCFNMHLTLLIWSHEVFMFLKLKILLEVFHFESHEDIQHNVTKVLEKLSENYMQECFQLGRDVEMRK